MNGSYIAVLVLIFVVIIPWINQKKRLAVIEHIKNKKYNKENNAMKELAKQFIGKECIIYTVTGTDSVIKGIVKEVTDGGIVVEKKDGTEAVNLEYVTRIREWPRNSKGKKKQIFE
jgi:vacuolar-type H+-ATPase subunit E/Vma4